MRVLKQFDQFQKEGIVRKVSINSERAKSLILESERKMKSLHERIDKLGITDDNANDYVEYCYDTIMHLVRAKLYLEGYGANGQVAHEAEIAYLRILGLTEKDILFADELRYFRNGILYYGTSLDKEYAQKVVAFTKTMVPRLKKLIQFEFKYPNHDILSL